MDSRWGKRVQQRLERYKMPATLCREHGWPRQPIKPVFFAPTDIQPGDLSEEIMARLRASKNLVVIASPRSAQSEWVGKEIAYFHSLPQGQNIFFFIIDGQPMSGNPQTECYNPIIYELGMCEPLGVNIHEQVYHLPWLNRERAYIQLITKLLGIEFDELWQRHRRRKRRHVAIALSGLSIMALTTVQLVYANGSTPVKIILKEATPHNIHLDPRKDAVIRVWIDGEERRDTLKSEANNEAVFEQVPRKYLGHEVRVNFECYDFVPIDTLMTLAETMTLPYRRDEMLFGRVEFTLTNILGLGLPNQKLSVGGYTTVTDAEGHVSLTIPIECQKTKYNITCDRPMLDSVIVVPCGDGVVIKTLE